MTALENPLSMESQAEAIRILKKEFVRNDMQAVDPDKVFHGLFTDPKDTKRRQHDLRCFIGRVHELCYGDPTSNQLTAIIDVSQVPGLEPVRRIVYDLLANGTLEQKKKAACALSNIDQAAAAITRGLNQLVDKPAPKPEVKKIESPRLVCGTELVSGR